MADLGRAAGGAVKMVVNGKELTLSPITIGDLKEFEIHWKSERVKAFLEALTAAGADKKERMEGVVRLLTIPFTAEDLETSMGTMEGMALLLWYSIKKKQPKYTMAQVNQIQEMEEVLNAVSAISGLGRGSGNPTEDETETAE